jgi:hypothetical protein
MPAWVLLIEYLPLFTLFAVGYILKRYAREHWIGGLLSVNKTEKILETQK